MSDHERDERRIAAALKAVEGLPTEELEAGIVAEVIESFRILMTFVAVIKEAGIKFPTMVNEETGKVLGSVNPAAALAHFRPLNLRLSKALEGRTSHGPLETSKRRGRPGKRKLE